MKILTSIFIFIFLIGCKTSKLPSEKYNQYEYQKSFIHEGDLLKIELKNPLHCPLRIWIFNDNDSLQNRLSEFNPIELDSRSDTIIILNEINHFDNKLNFASRLGSLSKEIKAIKMDFPFPENKEYEILQGNNTNFTHNRDYNRYAIDFNLKTNDTISSATAGYVVGIVDKYEFGGTDPKWKPFSNFITIYDPDSGIFCQYAHLIKDGSLVKMGDKVEIGQPIALSGNTGHSTIEHLHFNCLIPADNNDGLKSIPIEFINGQKSIDLKKGDIVKKNPDNISQIL